MKMTTMKSLMAVAAFALASGNITQATEKDFNGDGYSDLVWENIVTGQRGFWFMHNGTATGYGWVRDQNGQTVSPPSAEWHIVGVTDFLGDGNADLVWQNSVTDQTEVWFLKNGVLSSKQSMNTTSWKLAAVGQSWESPNGGYGPAFFHIVDFIWVAGDGSLWVEYIKDGLNGGSFYPIHAPIDGPNDPIAGGFLQPGWHIDGDFANPAFFGNQSDQNGIVLENTYGKIAFGNIEPESSPNYSSATVSTSIKLPTGWHIAGTGDFNGDGSTDLALENPTTGQCVVWMLDSAHQTVTAGYWLPTQSTQWRIVNH